MEFTKGERNHLLRLLQDEWDKGEYYGNYAQYWERHARLVDKLSTATSKGGNK